MFLCVYFRSIGIITVEMITGVLPWGKLKLHQILRNHMQRQIPEYELPKQATDDLKVDQTINFYITFIFTKTDLEFCDFTIGERRAATNYFTSDCASVDI